MNASVFQTLADPTRLKLIEILARGEHAVNDLVEQTHIHQSGVSRHLKILQGAGFVTVRPSGQQRFYSLAREPFRQIDAWLGTYRRHWDDRLDRLGRALTTHKEKK
jgi:DNA-binding transcriptional ArsR family regulator